jgi:2-polyprenyl-3-methyl-5-hydroxy-6-metoxy-1,4-benzoquinol methylase
LRPRRRSRSLAIPVARTRASRRSETATQDSSLYERDVSEIVDHANAIDARDPCPVCASVRARPRFAVEGIASRLVVCEGCGSGRLDPLPSDAEIASYYPDAYYGDPGRAKFSGLIEWLVRLVGARHVRFFLAGLPEGARVLDVGCGRGVLLREIASRGFEAHGIELSEAAARGADPRAHIRIAPRLSEAGYPDAFFDEVILWHVLEHLRDPRETLQQAQRVLRPGGRLVIAVPNFTSAQARWAGPAWFHLDLPRHLHHFGLSALERLITDTGFICEARHHFSLRQNPFGWIQSALNRSPSLPRNGLYQLLHRRDADGPPLFDAATRRRLVLRGALLAPIALALTVLAALARTGATVHVVARRG